ncbi:MAG TPA: hypothetical protein VGM33_25970 [Baekduia sp.]|jgi:hypothetical protein
MSTHQRNHACVIAVEPSLGAVLHRETLLVLEDHHHFFEDLSELSPAAQYGLSLIFRESFAVLDALGWPTAHTGPASVPLTTTHIDRLRRRHHDLIRTHHDQLATTTSPTDATTIRTQIDATHLAALALAQLFTQFERAMRG